MSVETDIVPVEELLSTATAAVRAGGEIVTSRLRKISSVRFKGKSNPVTDVDLLAEEAIVAVVRRRFPSHNILSEEVSSLDQSSDYTWVIDPVDGTVNLTQGIPFLAVAVALAFQGTALLGAIYDPLRKEMFTAAKDMGALLNGKRIAVATKERLDRAVIGVDLGYDDVARHRALETMIAIRPEIQSFRLLGSAVLGLSYVACGRFDAYFHPFVYPWDIMAAALLIQEAGGRATDLDGNDITKSSTNILAANDHLHKQLLRLVVPVQKR